MDHPIPQTAPFIVTTPAVQTAPLVFASPHSGRDYRPDFLAAARLDALGLRRSEDSFVDELLQGVADHGAPLLAATFPRAYCDPNREPWELDPAMFDGRLPSWVNTTSPRVGAGLGTIARIVASGETIYKRKLDFNEAEQRVRRYWFPYHQALTDLIEATRARFGMCLLLDCHSMPSHGFLASKQPAPDIILGDAHGTSCAASIVRHVETTLTAFGYTVRRNDPYAGGYVTRHYGRPREHVHALQIEVSRSLYMDESLFTPRPGFAHLQRHLTLLAESLADVTGALAGQSDGTVTTLTD